MTLLEDEIRKQAERDFHDRHRVEHDDRPNRKFYAISGVNNAYVKGWLAPRCPGRRVLDYGCGEGEFAVWLAAQGAETYAIDISPVSVENGVRAAKKAGVEARTHFSVMDAESLTFEDDYFDLIVVNGVLHHLKLDRAYLELARVVKPGGFVVAAEALRHNPLIRWYRRRTPDLRTAWEAEHILGKPEIESAREYFGSCDVRTFHLFAIAAVPFRRSPAFGGLLKVLAAVDSVVLRLPVIRWQAWIAVFILSRPHKRVPAPRAPKT